MAGRHFLFVPGPTHVPERVQRAMHRAMVDHRSSAFPELTLSILRDLSVLFGTGSGHPFVFAATGTGFTSTSRQRGMSGSWSPTRPESSPTISPTWPSRCC